MQKEKEKIKMRFEKFWFACGLPVDLRRDSQLKEKTAELKGVRNPQYKFIHKVCDEERVAELNEIERRLSA